jgi:alpha-ribazole phosphatase/probable phosphoglycerate mutase
VTGIELVFETHSLTTDNEQGRATGWIGGMLSPSGRAFAAELGPRRREDRVDVVFASDLARAVETAEIAFSGTGIPVVFDWRLREIDYGLWNGAPVETIEHERANRVDTPFPGGESYRDTVARARSFLDDLAARHAGQRVVVIGHTATRWALDHLLDGRPLERLVVEPFDWRGGWEYMLRLRARAGAPA